MKKPHKKSGEMKLMKDEIRRIIVSMLAVSLVLVGGISCALNIVTMRETLQKTMNETAYVVAKQIYYHLYSMESSVEIIGSIARLSSETTSVEQKQEVLDGYVQHHGWEQMYLTDKNGKSVDGTLNVGDTDYFKTAIQGSVAFSEPFYSEQVEKMVVAVAAPLWKDGKIDTEIVGAVCATIDAHVFTEAVSEIKVSDNGASYMIDASGDTIAHANFELVEIESNTIEDAKSDRGLTELAELEQKMINGEEGFGKYSYGGVTKYMAYAPVGMNGWSVAVTAPVADFSGSVMLGIMVTILLLVTTLIVAVKKANEFGTRIGGAVHVCAERLQLLAQGDLETEVPIINAEDETGILSESTAKIVKTQQMIIGDVDYLLHQLAEGNFIVQSKIGQDAYVGSYRAILEAMRTVRDDMTETLRSISEASDQVEAGSSQLATASQSLAEGSTEQAGAIEELLATVMDVTQQVEKNNEATDMAHHKFKLIDEEANESSKMMEELTQEMKNIQDTSAEINKIITEIEEIASQTNLLSLNASIEAARAGEAGRGFAVVADQIGKLAEQSAQSAVNTRHLIEASIAEVNKGSNVTATTAEHMESMMTDLKSIMEVIANIREASDSQTMAVEQIRTGVEQISNVVRSNSAAAEETSATSEELSAQAQCMDSLVARFNLPE